MSSTNFTVGLNNGRNSSRVLKPPGGGHSDIFGAQQEGRVQAKPRQQCQIVDCFKMEEGDKKEVQNETVINDKHEEETENNAPTPTETDNQPLQPSQPQRVRVPPGGFSSGFW